MDHFEGKECKFKFFSILISLKTKGDRTTAGVLQEVIKMGTSRQSVACFWTFLQTFLIISWLNLSAKLLTHCT